ncbi:Oligosaccharide translocation protein rft1, partial [Ceratobasidium sp. 392]
HIIWETLGTDEASKEACKRAGAPTLYNQSKKGNVLFSNELARRYADQGIISVAVNPGNLKTELQRHLSWFAAWVLDQVIYPASYGALTQLWAGTMLDGEQHNGKFLIPWARVGAPPAVASEEELAGKLWTWLEEQPHEHKHPTLQALSARLYLLAMTTTSKNKASHDSADPDVAKGSVNSAYSLIALQVLSRVATFTLNQVLLRLASPKVFGTAAIQLDLLLSTVLFISREGVRNALLRIPRDSLSSPKVVNVSTLPVLLGAPLAFLITTGYRTIASDATRMQPHFDLAVSIYAAAALVDLLSEPLHNRAQGQMRFDLRVKAEGTAIISRSVFTVVSLYLAGEEWSLVAFAGGQLASLAFDPSSSKLALTMTGQSIFKHFLTEGDRIVISRVSPLEDQGGYAVASNYGSLVARILFQPIEESSRLYFSKLLSPPSTSTTDDSSPQAPKSAQNQAATTLQSTLFIHSHLALALTTLLAPLIP